MSRAFFGAAYRCLVSSFVACFLVPLYMIGQGPENYNFIDWAIFLQSAVVLSALLAGLSFAICSALLLLKFEKSALFFSSLLFYWIFTSGYFLPLVDSSGVLDIASLPQSNLNIFLVSLVSVCFGFIAQSSKKTYVVAFSVVVILVSLLQSVYSIYEAGNWTSSKDSLSLSQRNIIVLSLDGLPGRIVYKLVRNEERYSEGFSDFTIFENVVAHSPSTASSILGELFGVRDYKKMGDSIPDIAAKLREQGIVDQLLLEQHENSYQYDYGNFGKKIRVPPGEKKFQLQQDTVEFFRYPFVRMGSVNLLKVLGWHESMGAITRVIVGSDSGSDLIARINSGAGYAWDRRMNATILDFVSYEEGLRVDERELAIRYLHFTFTHSPVDFDENCDFRSDEKSWHTSNQDEVGLDQEATCALEKYLGFLERLRGLGVYEDSLIIFKSDHGKPATYYENSPQNLTINGNGYGYDRYRPMLMVKPNFAKNDKPIFKENLVLLNDLAKTVCENSRLKDTCEDFPGQDLLGEDAGLDAPYFLYVQKNSHGGPRFEDLISISIPSRKASLLDSLESDDAAVLSPYHAESAVKEAKLRTQNNQITHKTRLFDLEKIHSALLKYYGDNGDYPVSVGWDGLGSKWGSSTKSYISGLVPNYLDTLPLEPTADSTGKILYMYKSNGVDFKLLVHGRLDYDLSQIETSSSLIDPMRKQWAYGYWSAGGQDF